ncbi:SIS domain-containing protein [Anoxybacterium hadale]|uniref:SIS domain-containing protein n=1 Tax=Anoxybacterium hadale TaxID=3408580 RepID=A0ACD1AE48_9FIRM|nr:SIS domain-containing protein [Clostridiales bacterium]
MMKEYLSNYSTEIAEKLLKTDFELLEEIIQKLIETKGKDGTIFTAGNGGSAATASHMANDFTKGCRVHNREGFKIICLADSTPIVTCLANDFSYEDIFSIPLRTQGKRGDVLVVFSGSGNSPNIVKAVETAKEMNIFTIGFSGRDGGKLAGLCDLLLIAPTDNMEQLEDMHMIYEHAMSCAIQNELMDMWGVEIRRYPKQNAKIKSALFDFDGTLSLIREGWQDVMIPYFIEVLKETPKAEEEEEIKETVRTFVDTLTGKQTIFQCIRLAEEVAARGGQPREALEYKTEYLRRLRERIEHRHEELKAGCDPEKYTVTGARRLLKALRECGIKTYLASGTDEEDVLMEVRLLQLEDYFDGGIYGALDGVTDCSKELVIRKIISENQLSPDQLISFGDGYVEIELVKNLGGYTFGVASDEVRQKGINQWKRERLIQAGADAIIPDFEDTDKIMELIR